MRLDFQRDQPERFALGLIANHENGTLRAKIVYCVSLLFHFIHATGNISRKSSHSGFLTLSFLRIN